MLTPSPQGRCKADDLPTVEGHPSLLVIWFSRPACVQLLLFSLVLHSVFDLGVKIPIP